MDIKSKIYLFYKLIRLNKPTGLFLLMVPSLFAINMASVGFIDYFLLLKFIAGAFLMRSSGCIINDYFDRHFDKKVNRTKDRPLANEEISPKNALFIALLMTILAFLILLTMNVKVVIIGCLSIIPIILYPLVKRFSFYPQIFLGLTFNLGILMAFMEIQGQITGVGYLIYAAFAIWTVSYDIVYALQDIEDDKKIGVKSMAIILGKSVLNIVDFLNIWFVFIILCVGVFSKMSIIYFLGCIIVIAILRWQKLQLKSSTDSELIGRIFQSNNYILLILFLISFFKES